ncbi:hypothetical protein EVAR_34115_1 [Eumeta japonica]|uniref:Uncharacterized protein n=1 Tax=Eumeta variegata TaxID=151549 RepID=A0A4C1WLZ3_EUMVA|nr:hypothetical protein EVAR_34115_1 [Eumeta japonica]
MSAFRGPHRTDAMRCSPARHVRLRANCAIYVLGSADAFERGCDGVVSNHCVLDLYLSLAVFQIIGHLYILKHDLASISRPKKKIFIEIYDMPVAVEMFDDEENKQVYKDITDCISYHCMIIRFTDAVSVLFGPTIAISYLFHLFGCCLSLLQVLSGASTHRYKATARAHLIADYILEQFTSYYTNPSLAHHQHVEPHMKDFIMSSTSPLPGDLFILTVELAKTRLIVGPLKNDQKSIPIDHWGYSKEDITAANLTPFQLYKTTVENFSKDYRTLAHYGVFTFAIFGQLCHISIMFEVLGATYVSRSALWFATNSHFGFQSEKLIDAVYAVPWECMDVPNRRALLMLLRRVQTPIRISALGLADVGVQTMLGEINRRIASGWRKYWSLKEILKSKELSMQIKRKVLDTCALRVITYGCETWSLTKHHRVKLERCHRVMERSMTGIKKLGKKKWRWTGHRIRDPQEKWSKSVTDWYRRDEKSNRGRQQTRWEDNLKLTAEHHWRRVEWDRTRWKLLEEAYAKSVTFLIPDPEGDVLLLHVLQFIQLAVGAPSGTPLHDSRRAACEGALLSIFAHNFNYTT